MIYVNKQAKEEAFGMIKPEAIIRGLIDNIESRISDAGLIIEEKKGVVMNECQFKMLYGKVKHRQPLIYDALKDYMTTNQVIVLKVVGEDAVSRLLALRGSSNAKDALPGTIRGDYAQDQDYEKLYKEGKLALNVFHASDSLEEATVVLEEFFKENEKRMNEK